MTILLVMGVSGCGKTTIARGLADRLGWDLIEGDAFHPPANIAKMHASIPLDDADRAPWLANIAAEIDRARAAGRSAVLACSALKRAYRAVLIGARAEMVLIYLQGTQALIAARLAARTGHFMPPGLLASQFAALEEPGADENPIVLSIAKPPEAIIDAAAAALRDRNIVPRETAP
ncbi:MAG TPA: gluconokinase [Acetobacteraceae bacterium]|nr:gluconokinase [Acetobacteraceae bacterium]